MTCTFRRLGGRRGVLTAAATACAVTGTTLIAVAFAPHTAPPPRPTTAERASTSETVPSRPPSRVPELPPSPPTRVVAPRVGLEVNVDPVELDDDGSIALPRNVGHAGWFTGSLTPGQKGNTVLVGHVDSHDGPAAFYELGAVHKGDRVEVKRQDGRTVSYEVESISIWPQDDFPSRRVYGPTPGPRLTLITCTDWDAERRTYVSNLVVTARPTTQ
ncbi:class F sortase [Streptomyces sp. NPDC048109]|uniref:class F sortase n=1 Tax=Streptomyces TaxID=1883 RepID=UPI00343A8B56